MKNQPAKKSCRPSGENLVSEFLILPDGRILAHNLTPVFAGLLAGLNPECEQITSRVTRHESHKHELPN
ncbi:MAG: hypothetical protein ABSC01_05070 [Verrucomicrobiota bacterium]|jgi:hypothetical protein